MPTLVLIVIWGHICLAAGAAEPAGKTPPAGVAPVIRFRNPDDGEVGWNDLVKGPIGMYWNSFIYENEMHDLFGIQVRGMNIDFKGTLIRTAVKFPFSQFAGHSHQGGQAMTKQIIVPFGPQHPILPEPIHLDLVLEDEKVVDVIPSIGYIHRGFEKLVEKREFTEYVYIAERTCGISSFIHGATFCQGIEQTMNIDVPERAQYLRVIWSEFSRLHSHLLWLGCYADSFGFENLFMGAWKTRERVLDFMGRRRSRPRP